MKKSPWLLAPLAAGLLLLGLHPLDWTWFSWIGFLPLFFLLLDPSLRSRTIFFAALFTGIIYFGVGLYWLLYFDAKIYALAFLIVAPVFAVYFALLSLIFSKTGNFYARMVAVPLLWVLIQKAYALSPIGTIATEVPFYGSLNFFQTASAPLGFVTVAALLLGLNFALASFVKKKTVPAAACAVLCAGLLTGIYFWGSMRLQQKEASPLPKIAVIQHNFPVSGVWRLEHPVFIRAEYRRLALEAAQQKPDLIIFPLYSFPDDALRQPEFFIGLAQETKSWILAATYIPVQEGKSITQGFFNAALLYSPEGKLADYYQAVQAPPFRDVSETVHDKYKVLETPFGKLGVLLCYEDSLPRMARTAAENGAAFLVALSNPGHFVSTHMPYYHLVQDRLRAIETGKWLVRASSNGYSAVVDPKGRFVQKSELNQAQILQVVSQ